MSKTPHLLEYSGRSWKEVLDILDKEVTTQNSENCDDLDVKTIRLLPRKDYQMYGEYPKVDTKVLVECDRCGMVLLPWIYQSHCNNPEHCKTPPNTNSSTTKPTTPYKNSKPTSNYIPPGTSLLKKKNQQPKNKKKSVLPPPVPPPPLFSKPPSPTAATAPTTESIPVVLSPGKPASPPQPQQQQQQQQVANASSGTLSNSTSGGSAIVHSTHSSSSLSSSTISKHKKNKKSAKRSKEESEKVEKTEKTATTEVNAGPKVVRVTVMGARNNNNNNNNNPTTKDSGKVKDYPHSLLDSPTDTTTTSLLTKISKDSTTSNNNRCVPSYIINQPQVTPPSPVDVLKLIQVSATTTPQDSVTNNNQSSIIYMPMSPVAVVNNVPVQSLKLPLLRVASTQPLLTPPLTTQPIVVTIPIQNSSTPMYTPHPKPLTMATRAIRKIGSTFLLQNQRLFHQRTGIEAITSRRAIANSGMNSFHHRPNILKNSAKSNVKLAIKRASSEKLSNESGKHIRLNEVNGFILHADVSESAESPLHNNSVHDKVTFLNMK